MSPPVRRCVLTGVGIVAPSGLGADAHWQATCDAARAIGPITRFDASRYPVGLGGQVAAFVPEEHVPHALLVQTDVWTQHALAATDLAFEDAKFVPPATDAGAGAGADAGADDQASVPSPFDVAVVTSASSGGNAFGQRQIQNLWAKGPKYVSAYQSIAWFYAASSGQISIRHGLKGPCGVLASEGAGGLDAVGHARRLIRRGTAAVVCGGTEAPLSPYALVCHLPAGQLSTAGDPATAYRPFAPDAGGYVLGEGGAILLLEELDSALRRGASQVYAEVAGYAATHDGRVGPPSGGDHLARAAQLALADAGVGPSDVDAVFADAWGTVPADRAEVAALRRVFGDRAGEVRVPVTAPKALVGRLHSGGAALDVATAALALHTQHLPPTAPAGAWPVEGIDLVMGAARPIPLDTVLVLARGQGGFNAAVVLRRVHD